MYVTAERLAVAEREVVEIFDQTSIAWQVFPNWNTGDPGQSRVRNDIVDNPGFLTLESVEVPFQATLAQLGAPTPDSLLAEVMARSTDLARRVDWRAFKAVRAAVEPIDLPGEFSSAAMMNTLIRARARVEDAGYRAPSCLVTNTAGLIALNTPSDNGPTCEAVLKAANINALQRTSLFINDDPIDEIPTAGDESPIMLLVGRRQRIAPGAGADASPGEEPVDLAISVAPSLEVLGEAEKTEAGVERGIEMGVRIRFVTRVTDPRGVVLLAGAGTAAKNQRGTAAKKP